MTPRSDGLFLDLTREDDLLAHGREKLADGITRAGDEAAIDPLVRLLDPEFKKVLWEYEGSRTEQEIPGQLHAKQTEALSSDKRHRWLFWGNQAGKSTTGAIELALLALGRHPHHQRWEPGLVLWASALTWELWETVLLPELLTWIPDERIIDAPEPYKKSHKRTILVLADNGKISRIEGKSAEQGAAKYQSRRLHAVWFDEEHPEAIYNEVLPRLLRHGGITITTATPLKGLTWIHDRIYQPWKRGDPEAANHFCSHAGVADNPGIHPEEIELLKNELRHNPALLAARLHGMFMRPEGLVVSNFDPIQHTFEANDAAITTMLARGTLYAGVDFGWWRFAFVLGLVDRAGRMHIIEELFSPRQLHRERAQSIHDLLQKYGAPKWVSIWGDAANPQDIAELNDHFSAIGSPYRVIAVGMENKIRRVGASRIRDLFGRGVLRVRRGMGEEMTWMLGQGAGKPGTPVRGSRFRWELNNWCYPDKVEDKDQKEDPSDASADGADMMAALRYLVMSWWKPPKVDVPPPESAWDKRVLQEESERLRRGLPPPGHRKKKPGRRYGELAREETEPPLKRAA